ncbi:MAG: four-carbon acid sugar kinase family protein [Actinobacteria bacterium]|nr:four-carbon acid sugar kinase family protein [Actinomycetota bacterium]
MRSAGRQLTACFYGDDFTGAADALLQYGRAGLRARLVVDPGLIGAAAAEGLDVLGVAGVARALPSERIAREIEPVLDALAWLEPRFLQYKVCSTFDSSPERGSIGRACEVARDRFPGRPIPVLAAQPGLGRYTLFSNHFARAGDGLVYRLDEHPTMSVHPVTPARDANLVRVLAAQAPELEVGALDLLGLRGGGGRGLAAEEGDVIVVDAIDDSDLVRVGAAIWAGAGPDPLFVVGSGGLSRGLATQLRGPVPAVGELGEVGAMLALAGSASPDTRRQVGAATRAGWAAFALPEVWRDGGEELLDQVVETIAAGRSVVVHPGSATPGTGVVKVGEEIGDALARLLGATAAETSLRRVLVAGGDTCGSVFQRLDVDAFELIGDVSEVPVCRVSSRVPGLDGIEVALKGGQIGAVDLFDRARAGQGVALR